MAQHPGSRWLDLNWNPSQLPDDKWVAATDGGIAGQGDTLEDIMAQLDNKGIDYNDVTFTHVYFGVIQ